MVFTMIHKIMRILLSDGCGAVALKQLVCSSFSVHKIMKVITTFRFHYILRSRCPIENSIFHSNLLFFVIKYKSHRFKLIEIICRSYYYKYIDYYAISVYNTIIERNIDEAKGFD